MLVYRIVDIVDIVDRIRIQSRAIEVFIKKSSILALLVQVCVPVNFAISNRRVLSSKNFNSTNPRKALFCNILHSLSSSLLLPFET
ncbi:hypothetical protein [Microcoleus sp. N9_A1]|uniref:hypothetical protein n=1 Tax=Microcoleus sp. N9_A1 TaxID=3055380 RepID=UPI002FD241CD